MKTLTIAGNIGKDAVTRTTQGGDSVTGWTVAVTERAKGEEKTLWFDCSMWGKRGEALSQYLTKGSKVTVAGDFGTREHEGKTYLTLRVNDLTLQGGKPGDSGGDNGRSNAQRSDGYGAGGRGSADLDEIPFAPVTLI